MSVDVAVSAVCCGVFPCKLCCVLLQSALYTERLPGYFKSFRFFKELLCKRLCTGPNRFYGIMFSAPFSAFGKAGAHCPRYYSVRRDKGADGLRLTFSSINQICIKFKIGKFGYGVKSAASGGFNYGTLIPLFVFFVCASPCVYDYHFPDCTCRNGFDIPVYAAILRDNVRFGLSFDICRKADI